MPKKSHSPFMSYSDIIESCKKIRYIVERVGDVEALLAQNNTPHSIEYDSAKYHFIIIGEAITRMRAQVDKDEPDYPWGDVVGMGLCMKHEYEAIAERAVRAAVAELDRLQSICERQRGRYDLNRAGFRLDKLPEERRADDRKDDDRDDR